MPSAVLGAPERMEKVAEEKDADGVVGVPEDGPHLGVERQRRLHRQRDQRVVAQQEHEDLVRGGDRLRGASAKGTALLWGGPFCIMAMVIITAMVIYVAVFTKTMSRNSRDSDPEAGITELFLKGGWEVHAQSGDADFLIRKLPLEYAVEIKTASEGRADRLVPLMAQAILQARSYAMQHDESIAPLALVVAPRIGPRVVQQIREFARSHAPDVSFGIVDQQGLRDFSGPGLEELNADPDGDSSSSSHTVAHAGTDLFSDLNQWMTKVLVAPELNNPRLLNAPVGRYRNASELAQAAQVSVMTAFRFIRQLRHEGFLHESSRMLRLVRLADLLDRWQAAAVRPAAEISARWILPGNKMRLHHALEPLGARACLGLFAAADALDLGFVHGAPTHIYVASLRTGSLSEMGLIATSRDVSSEVVVKVPAARESMLRGSVMAHGLRASDALQVWLDVASHPSRGKEQAQLIFDRVIAPLQKRAANGQR